MSDTEDNTISGCCNAMSACEAVCMLNNALIKMGLGEAVTSYKVGAESFTFKQPSMSSVRSLLAYYQGLCNQSQGKISRERAKLRVVFGDNGKGSHCSTRKRCR